MCSLAELQFDSLGVVKPKVELSNKSSGEIRVSVAFPTVSVIGQYNLIKVFYARTFEQF